MTATELQRIALNLSNQCFTRYWLNFNHACGETQVQMAISCSDGRNTLEVSALKNDDFKTFSRNGRLYYVALRTNEDGTPYFSAIN